MKNKIFFQNGFGVWIKHIVVAVIFACGIVGAILEPTFLIDKYDHKWLGWGLTISYYIALCVLVCVPIIYMRHRIMFKRNDIFVPCQWSGLADRVQYKFNVRYADIADIRFIRSVKNSIGGTIRDLGADSFYHHYIEFLLKDGIKQRIWITYFSKKQKIKILEETEKRLRYCGNDIDLTEARKSLEELKPFGRAYIRDMDENWANKKAVRNAKKVSEDDITKDETKDERDNNSAR